MQFITNQNPSLLPAGTVCGVCRESIAFGSVYTQDSHSGPSHWACVMVRPAFDSISELVAWWTQRDGITSTRITDGRMYAVIRRGVRETVYARTGADKWQLVPAQPV